MQLAFTVILPTSPTLTELTDVLRTKGIAAILNEVTPAPVALALPKFTTRSSLDLVDTLRAAGMRDAFSETDADFSGITEDARIFIKSVRHKTFVQVDEHGTEAAAATGIDARATSAMPMKTVTVDHPFLFVITDTATGAPLFLGRVADPTA